MNTNKRKKITITVLIISVSLVSTGMTLQYYDNLKNFITSYKILQEVYERIREDYVEETVGSELIYNAIDGMISDLDPHSKYLKPDYFEKFNQNYAGYSGIGITFDVIRNRITIMSIIPNGPSEKAGLKAGDRIVAIDGNNAVGMSRDDAPKYLMGARGTKVTVAIDRNGFSSPRPFTIIRDEVHVESIPYAFILKPQIGYIGIVRFSSTTGQELRDHLEELKNQGMTQLILDLRQNSGGYLDASAEVVDRFLPRGKQIVYTEGRNRDSFRNFYSTGQHLYKDLPMIVLIDRFSASASEIVAGSLQDWDRALIAGETSFGKGLVQSQYRFQDGSALLITTAKYFTPIGRQIQRPYDDVPIEDYYTQIINDPLRQQWEKNPERPVYRTKLLRRKVLGGGGISPDIFLRSPQDTVSKTVHTIVQSPKRLLFTFIEDYLNTNTKPTISLTDFLREYQPGAKMLNQFLGYLREMGMEISSEDFYTDRKDISFFLKQTIADQLWGETARYKVQLTRDRQLVESLTYLKQASKLLSSAY